ncbi:hypothetical protein SKAU_G00338300 [Synaphobranchus kaupii]|uniref:Uncharacterized protein n=1 Tax=Synaphobranchus kaupii TaxID=118154 RepID=A0A9Q1EMF5_SYNKA|nr:hypothetical protein SKAU_G00338300 [Synaphobranchus kaupii]
MDLARGQGNVYPLSAALGYQVAERPGDSFFHLYPETWSSVRIRSAFEPLHVQTQTQIEKCRVREREGGRYKATWNDKANKRPLLAQAVACYRIPRASAPARSVRSSLDPTIFSLPDTSVAPRGDWQDPVCEQDPTFSLLGPQIHDVTIATNAAFDHKMLPLPLEGGLSSSTLQIKGLLPLVLCRHNLENVHRGLLIALSSITAQFHIKLRKQGLAEPLHTGAERQPRHMDLWVCQAKCQAEQLPYLAHFYVLCLTSLKILDKSILSHCFSPARRGRLQATGRSCLQLEGNGNTQPCGLILKDGFCGIVKEESLRAEPALSPATSALSHHHHVDLSVLCMWELSAPARRGAPGGSSQFRSLGVFHLQATAYVAICGQLNISIGEIDTHKRTEQQWQQWQRRRLKSVQYLSNL